MQRVLLIWICLMTAAVADEGRSLFDGQTLAGWTKAPFGGSGEVEVMDGAIVLNQGILTGVNYTNAFPVTDYEVEVEARRVVGSDFFCGLTFPVKDSFATLIIGGWGGSVIGISSLDDQDAAHNETTLHRRFEAGRWYRIRLQVRTDRLKVWLDGDPVIDTDIRTKNVSLRPGDIELSKPFGFASYSTTAELRNIRMRSLAAPVSSPTPPIDRPATTRP